jgi:acetolactate synthase-1/2/3 large subunit
MHPPAYELNTYGLYPSDLRSAEENGSGADPRGKVAAALDAFLERGDEENGLTLALIELHGRQGIEELIAGIAEAPAEQVAADLDARLNREFALTGAEATALMLAHHDVEVAFAYAGTSELALCDAVARSPGIELVNGRGDKECAFMAGGASLVRPRVGAAIIHAARGLTNACGAIADVRRSELGSVGIVGMPSLASGPYLPPHSEPELLDTIGRFAKWSYDPSDRLRESGFVPEAAEDLMSKLAEALREAATRPFGPVLFGVPQDAGEKRWLPWSVVSKSLGSKAAGESGSNGELQAAALAMLRESRQPVIMVDDYLLKYPQGRPALRDFANALGAPLVQVRYTRGAMLFERLSREDVEQFVGWYSQDDAEQQDMLAQSDLLITIEDRNMYVRVIGPLPEVPKLAINSSAAKVEKNEYLGAEDVLLVGDTVEALRRLTAGLGEPSRRGPHWFAASQADRQEEEPGEVSAAALVRLRLADAFSAALGHRERPILVDDSQMLGGLLCEEYDRLPAKLRIHGSHGGFVGSGLATATGLALGEPRATVVCTLGDQGFTNGSQGLAAAGQEGAPVTFVVCNNGGSISLEKQARSDYERAFDSGTHRYLANAPNVSYPAVAEAFGVKAITIQWSPEDGPDAIDRAGEQFAAALEEAISKREPRLIELRLPPLGETWEGVWETKGKEPAPAGAGVAQ